jgi:hypothetical protein
VFQNFAVFADFGKNNSKKCPPLILFDGTVRDFMAHETLEAMQAFAQI